MWTEAHGADLGQYSSVLPLRRLSTTAMHQGAQGARKKLERLVGQPGYPVLPAHVLTRHRMGSDR